MFFRNCTVFRILVFFRFLWAIHIEKINQPKQFEKAKSYYGKNTEDNNNIHHNYLLFCL